MTKYCIFLANYEKYVMEGKKMLERASARNWQLLKYLDYPGTGDEIQVCMAEDRLKEPLVQYPHS